jgi:ribonuclease HII
MMVIAGIDEAGYGPVLGPLVVGCCAFRTPDAEPLPCLWERLERVVSKKRSKDGRKLHVNDSKLVYRSGNGLKELERSVLCLLQQAYGEVNSLDAMLAVIDAALPPVLAEYRWYSAAPGEAFPAQADAMTLRITGNALKVESERAETQCIHYRAHVLPERQFNDLVEKMRNKASASFSLVARHIDLLMREYADQNLVIYCDRQGGRSHYGRVLRLMWEDWALEILQESDARSGYRLRNGPRSARIIFCEKAELACLPVAAASMLAKYTREMLMGRFNRFWQQHRPALNPTAGYYTDGWRFLNEIADLRKELAVADVDLIRQR